MRRFLTWATTAALGAAMLFGCTNTEGFGDRPNIGVGGGASSSTGTGSGTGSGVGGASSTGSGSATSGTSGNGVTTGGSVEEATFAVSLSESDLSMDLDDTVEIAVEITSTGDVGTVTFDAIGLPSGVAANFSPPSVTLGSAGSDAVVLTLTSLSSASVGDAGFTVVASSADQDETAGASVTVEPVLTIVIPSGVAALGGSIDNPYLDAYGPYPITVTAAPPVTVYVYNADQTSHEIHSDAGEMGFPHGNGPIAPQSMDPVVRQLQVNGTYNFYLHDQGGPATPGRIVMQ
jgi:hypothetical protein